MKVFCVFLMLQLIPFLGFSTDYYVSPTGSDSNSGSQAQPWKTIQKAANTLTAGDTVYIKTGTYSERVTPQNSGTAGNYITYRAYSNDKVTIDGRSITLPADWGGLFDISGKSYIKIIGLRVINAGPDLEAVGILVDAGSYITIQNNYTYNTVSSGIAVWNSSNIIIDNNEVELACNDGDNECLTVAVTDTFEIKNNTVHNGGPGSNGGEGIDAKDGSSNGKIYNNQVFDMNRLGIYVDAWDKHTFNIDIYNNIVYNCKDDGFTLASESGGLLENINLYNNIAYNNDVCGLTVSQNGDSSTHPMKDIEVINNTFYNNGAGGWGGGIILDNANLQGITIRNNILSGNPDFQLVSEPYVPTAGMTVENNLIHGFRDYDGELRGDNYVEGDPLFVNASGADFHLQSTSPAIDQGTSSGAPATDFEGNSRSRGNGYDIGAYEYGSSGGNTPVIALSPTTMSATSLYGSTTAHTKPLTISNSGSATLNWSGTSNMSWLSLSPAGGSGDGSTTVSLDPTGLSPGVYSGTVTISDTNATPTSQTVSVTFTIISIFNDEEPFGSFDSPVHNSTASSSIAVTGWALDEFMVESLKIYRDPVNGEGGNPVYIGDAVFVEGARPDVAASYASYPYNTKAGWGYMLLTNFLPNGGNGTFTLYAVASDARSIVTLGSKTITCDNANAVKPFGAIDTPTQGGTASGKNFLVWGWALTPLPYTIATDGSSINVLVDGVSIGHPVYGVYREDIATLFPSYNNSNGAVGYIVLDTTVYSNGVHTIQWTVMDNAGNSDGIGSRYFIINNPD